MTHCVIIKKYSGITALLAAAILSLATQARAIVNGTPVTGQEPFAKSVVGLALQAESGFHIFCTASLINANTAVTAAHCIYDHDDEGIYVVFGLSESDPGVQTRPVITHKAQEINEGYEPVTGNDAVDTHDIALVQFQGPLPAGFHPLPILASDQPLQEGTEVILTGYGYSAFDLSGLPESSGTLRQTTVKLVDTHSAKTEVKTDEGQSGTCAIDSGGPGFIVVNGQYYLWGATSRGRPDCQGGEGTYTKVTDYSDWITSKLKSWASGGHS